jgi:5-oxoprolinase (ATP-hydrolysing)
MNRLRYALWVDRGGTFTDVLLLDRASGIVRAVKVLSNEGFERGFRDLIGLPQGELPPVEVRMGTTVGTNALLERRGAATTLVVTRGFADLVRVRDQARPDLFALDIARPPPLAADVVEVGSRAAPDGTVIARDSLVIPAATSVAIVLVHGHRAPELERALGRGTAAHVSYSHEVAPETGLLARLETTVADAYLTPLLASYLRSVEASIGSNVWVMQSSGGLTRSDRFRGRDSVLSGPAGGVVACEYLARLAGLERAVGLDMGGTSADVCRIEGAPERRHENEIAGVRLRVPMLAVHTVAAGGGSVCRYEGERLQVGPESAGADPGPLVYGRAAATDLTLTDVNVVLGRVAPERFPIPLDRARADAALEAMSRTLEAGGVGRSPIELAEGFFEIAIERMASAIRKVTVERGHDVRDHALIVFGGAAGQHACALARRLGIRTMVAHPFAGVMSALGMGVAPISWHGVRDVGARPVEPGLVGALRAIAAELEDEGVRALRDQGVEATSRTHRAVARYRGTDAVLDVPLDPGSEELFQTRFHRAHGREYGYTRRGHPVEVVRVRTEVSGGAYEAPIAIEREPEGPPVFVRPLRVEGRFVDAPAYRREALPLDRPIAGPALVLDATGTFVVEPGFELVARADGLLFIHAVGPPSRAAEATVEVDPVRLEVMSHAFMAVAEEMGVVLERTSLSPNIRERRDYSCAVFDPSGMLVANAPHIPVHLGAMGEAVRGVLRAHPDLAPGDVFATNDPALGGSHLPDITVITPVHDRAMTLRFFVASRGHHADVGGITPGSMPPFSSTLAEEGIVLRGERIVAAGAFDRDRARALFTAGDHPARRPDENLADLEGQIAAGNAGRRLLAELCDRYGADVVTAYLGHVIDLGEREVRARIRELGDGEFAFEDLLDEGAKIRVKAVVRGDEIALDFEGTSPEVATNLNAPRSVTTACVLYVLRCLVGRAIPLNDGCLRPVSIRIPPRSILDPSPERAVAGGNVETSQRVVDVLLGALGKLAGSQGTMNNVTFGNATYGYYETIGGGAGAGPSFDGASGVHVHMTNSRITDVEVLESRYPVRVVEFGLRRGSGGRGRHRGGDGLVRELEFLEPATVSILSERRVHAPFGLEGGEPGARGRNLLDGVDLGGKCTVEVKAGARLRIETPGGGGFGREP